MIHMYLRLHRAKERFIKSTQVLVYASVLHAPPTIRDTNKQFKKLYNSCTCEPKNNRHNWD